jgi:hypothetical protein
MSMTLEEQIAVQQAKLDDDALVIQSQEHGQGVWMDCPFPNWNFACFDFRVKPKPRVPRTVFRNEYRTGVFWCDYESREEAIRQIDRGAGFIGTIKWREVLDGPDETP